MGYVASLNQIGGGQNQYNVYKNFGYNVPAYKNIKMPIAYNNSQPRLTPQPKTDWYGASNPIQPKQADKQGMSNGTKLGIGAGLALGIGALAYVCSKGKVGSKQVQKLAEHIEFKEAKTMEEAVKFAKENLGIKKFDVGNDVEIANWVNNGLTRISNKYKGKAPIPNTVLTYPEALYQQALKEGKGVALADINSLTGEMRVNAHYFDDAKKNIERVMDSMGIKIGKESANGLREIQFGMSPFFNMQKQTDLLPQLIKVVDGTASKAEILTCELAISDMLCYNKLLCKQPELIYEHVLKSAKLKNIFNANKDINVLSLDKFKTLDKQQQVGYLYDLDAAIMKTKTGCRDIYDTYSEIRIMDRRPNVYHVIDHEIGHAAHSQALGENKFRKSYLLSDSEQNVAKTVSEYAATNSHEFVAEVYAELINGRTLSDEVMALYKKFGGPMLV